MTKLVSLVNLQFEIPLKPAKDVGVRGALKWVPLSKLLVDETYQRPIDASGKKNVKRIVEGFHWSLFSPVVVSPRAGGVFAVIDGQHRAAAAKLHGGIKELPCIVLSCTQQEEARAFSAINGIVTRVQTQYLFRARLAAGDRLAVAADEACRAAGARIMPYPMQASQLKAGETLAARTIEICHERYGRKVLVTALKLVTQTGNGNAGLLKEDIIVGFCDVLGTNPKWRDAEDAVRDAVAAKTVRAIFSTAMRAHADGMGSIRSQVSRVLTNTLLAKLGEGGCDAAPVKTPAMRAREESRRSHKRAFEISMPKKPLAASEQAAIADFLAKKGARKFESAATGNTSNLLDWLVRVCKRNARRASSGQGLSTKPYIIDNKRTNLAGLLAVVNAERCKRKLEPLTLESAD